jgi:hypothetical protein
MTKRLHAAEHRLWELSLKPGNMDMLLPPSLLQATLDEARARRAGTKPKHESFVKRDTSFLYERAAQSLQPPAKVRSGEQHPKSPRDQQERQEGSFPDRPTSARRSLSGQQEQHPKPPRGQQVRQEGSFTDRPASARRSLSDKQVRRIPASRYDAIALGTNVDRLISTEGDTLGVWDSALSELVEQVRTQCAERGDLLSRVRGWFLRHVWWLEKEAVEMREAAHSAQARAEELENKLQSSSNVSFNASKRCEVWYTSGRCSKVRSVQPREQQG